MQQVVRRAWWSPSPAGKRAQTCYTRPVHHLDFLDICAIMLGIWFTISKLDAQGRRAESFPQVEPAEFERWRSWTVSIFRLGSTVCFLRVVFHQGWAYYLSQHPVNAPAAPKSLVIPALLMDALFVSTVAATFIRGSRARELRRQLGIVLSPLSAKQAAALAPEDESKAATKPD
ncbi:MAG: hypothetical protein K0R38_3174 [Polyangiaceae bacterium]|nr:hypothetical protein [Polyangiaceae bacterium]